jgi:hypothetical protein
LSGTEQRKRIEIERDIRSPIQLKGRAVDTADLNRTITTAGGSSVGVGVDDDSRALEVSLEILQQVTVRVSVFEGQPVEQQFSKIA